MEQRISNPRGSRYKKYQQEFEAWRRLDSANNRYEHQFPGYKDRRLLVDRSGSTVYGLFWNNRLLKLGKTVWRSQAQAIVTFNRYVETVLALLENDDRNPLAQELIAFAKERGHKEVKDITNALRECGVLQVRELETIPMPPDEE